jgi:plastocyanin
MATDRLWRATLIPLAMVVLHGCDRRGDDPDTDAQRRTVSATLDEWTVRLEAESLDSGAVRFVVINNGQYHHALEFERGDEEWETDHIAPGDSAVLEMTLEPGTYEVYCPIDDEHGSHQQLGMRTRLVVR